MDGRSSYENLINPDRGQFIPGEKLDLAISQLIWQGKQFIIGIGGNVTDKEREKLENLILDIGNNGIDAKKLSHERMQIFVDSMITLVIVAESRDHTSISHIIRISHMVKKLADELANDKQFSEREKITDNFTHILKFAALLHDLGKLLVPESILNKQGLLTPSERSKINKHPEYGVSLLKSFIEPNLRNGFLGVFCIIGEQIMQYHHAYFSHCNKFYPNTKVLRGYPKGIHGKSIPLAARITTVVDVFEALSSETRMYPRWEGNGNICRYVPSVRKTLNIMKENAEQFDPEILRVLERSIEEGDLDRIVNMPVGKAELDQLKANFLDYLLGKMIRSII